MVPTKVACPSCGAPVRAVDAFCPKCGAAVPPPLPLAPAGGPRAPVSRRRSGRIADRQRLKSVASAAVAILVLAIVYALSGTIFGFMAKGEVDRALRNLSRHRDTEMVSVEGKTLTVAEWRKLLTRAPTLIFATSYGLAAIFLGLFFWARKRPFPAILTALALWLATIAVSAVIDPATLLQGLIVKVFALLALTGGLSAVLSQRSADRRRLAREAAHAPRA